MKPDVLDKLANDKHFRDAIWALGESEEHTDCSHDACMYGDYLETIERFFEHEYGITHDDILQVTRDAQREFDEWEDRLPKCCSEPNYRYGVCINCGTDMIDVPGLWCEWHCNECGERWRGAAPELKCRYAEKYLCPYPERHLKAYGRPAPNRVSSG